MGSECTEIPGTSPSLLDLLNFRLGRFPVTNQSGPDILAGNRLGEKILHPGLLAVLSAFSECIRSECRDVGFFPFTGCF